MAEVKLSAIPVDDLVRLLKSAGSSLVSKESIEADIAAGCPVNSDGSVNLMEYCAWLVGKSR